MVDVTLFDQRYEVLRELGRGNYGVTFLIREKATRIPWAGKFIERGPQVSVDVVREVQNHRQLLGCPYIIRFKEVLLTPTHLVVIMEFASGGELFQYVQINGRLSEDAARFFFRQLIKAVNYCHSSGIFHRDLKLENALIHIGHQQDIRLQLCDFGSSKHALQDSSLKSAKGTVEYLAPEVLLCSYCDKYEGQPSDIWACGVMLFIMLVGAYPYEDTNGQPHTAVRKIVKGEYVLPPNLPLSENCKNLIDRIFTVDTALRITMDQIQEHPWYTEKMDNTSQDLQHPSYTQIRAMQQEEDVRAVLAAASLDCQQK